MIPLTFNGAPALLVTEAPDWQAGFSATFALDRTVEASLSNREARRAYSAVPRVTALRYQTWVSAVAARQLVGGLRNASSTAILMPFWAAQDVWANRAAATISGGLCVVWKTDGSHVAVYPAGAEPSWPLAGDSWAPCLQGHFPDALKLDWLTDDLPRWEVSFTEDGPFAFALALAAQTWTPGPAPSSAYGGAGQPPAPDLAPFQPDWSEPVGESFTVKIIRERAGFRHDDAATFYDQAIARINESRYLLTGDDIGRFARFWMDHAAAAAVWMPNGASLARLTADLEAGSGTLSVDSSAALQAGDWLALVDASGNRATTQVVTVGPGTVGVAPAVGPMAAVGSAVQALLLARLDAPTLDLTWTHGALATARLGFREAPVEYDPDGSETLGTTLGALPARALLFEFTPLGGPTAYYTSYEQSVTCGGETYLSADFAHGDIRESLNLERTDVELTSHVFADHPWLPMLNLTAEAPMQVVIRWATVGPGGAASGAATMFTGQITEIAIRGRALTAKATPGGARFDQDLPRLSQSPLCWATLFNDGCNLAAGDWQFTAAAAPPFTPSYPYLLNLAALSAAGPRAAAALLGDAVFPQWFAGGWVEWTPAGGGVTQRRGILGSTPPAFGALTLTLDRWFAGNPAAGDALTVYPGCDQLWTTCGAFNPAAADTLGRSGPTGKFDNQINFRGAPFRPPANPAVVQRAATNSGGKKP